MVTIPAAAWRGGFVFRVLAIGGVVGLCLGGLAWLDSGFVITGLIVFVVLCLFYGTWMARRMSRYWPGSKDLTGGDRVAAVRAARRGDQITDPRLRQPVADYSKGLHAAADDAWPWRWLPALMLVVAFATAVWDAVYGSWGNVIASVIYLAALLVEVFWWPKYRQRLLINSDRAAQSSQ
jgi:hypothetical protein